MEAILTETKHRDVQAWKVTLDGQQIGFVFRTRFSWGYCNARKGGFPKVWQAADVKSQGEAVAKLIEWDTQARAMAAQFLK